MNTNQKSKRPKSLALSSICKGIFLVRNVIAGGTHETLDKRLKACKSVLTQDVSEAIKLSKLVSKGDAEILFMRIDDWNPCGADNLRWSLVKQIYPTDTNNLDVIVETNSGNSLLHLSSNARLKEPYKDYWFEVNNSFDSLNK